MVKRKNSQSIVEALTETQKIAFAPLAFQAIGSMLDFGILELIDQKPISEKDIINHLKLNEYTVRTLLQVGIINKLIKENDDCFSLTKTGKLFLYDEMTIANFNYVRHVCYLGASELTKSFKEGKPAGLHKFIKNSPTIYPIVPELSEKIKKSWYNFDHLYSDNCFEEVFKIANKKYNKIYDIGGNTGKFELVCLKHDENFDITLLDLNVNVENNKNNPNLKNCKFLPIDVLKKQPNYPKFENCAILMSQFLDCFSKSDIRKILTDVGKSMDKNSTIYILEPFTDKQKFEGAEYSLIHTSLYFTCMANGVSKMYTFKEMEELIKESGLIISNYTDGIGRFDYTVVECKNAVVSN